MTSEMTEGFRAHLRELWAAVEPHWVANRHADVDAVRRALDAHLAGTPRASEAMLLADRLHAMIDSWDGEDEEVRHVVCTAVTYFLQVDDAWNDLTAGGLSDDTRVVRAAEIALATRADRPSGSEEA